MRARLCGESLELHGYRGRLAEALREIGADVGDRIRLRRVDGLTLEGLLMPRFSGPDEVLVLKLPNGYNVGILFREGDRLERVESQRRGPPGAPVPLVEKLEVGEKKVKIIGCGGTVASRVDYETGAVKPYLSPEELALSAPEAFRYASIDAVQLFSVLSEDMKPWMWEKIVEEVEGAARSYDGVVVTHGTDTMSYTAAALAFAFSGGLSVTVALTGAQRSSDRPSSDASFNLAAAVLTASRAPFAEVSVVMHGESGDTYALAHRGTRVRKMHSTRRDAFRSINARPLAAVWPYEGRIEIMDKSFRERGGETRAINGFEERVALVQHFPGAIGRLIDLLVDGGFKGIVIAGTGMGHVSSDAVPSIRRAVELGVPVVVATQTIFGRVNLNVYTTGRKMLEAGAIPAGDMLAEVAYVKLSWALRRAKDVDGIREIMLTPLAGEMGERITQDLYPVWGYERP